MKKAFAILTCAVLVLATILPSHAQAATHKNTFTCTPSPDSTTSNPGTTNMYKKAGSCSSLIADFTKVQTGLPPACTSTDLSVASGQINSYVFTALFATQGESGPSNCITLTTPTFSPQGAQGTAQ